MRRLKQGLGLKHYPPPQTWVQTDRTPVQVMQPQQQLTQVGGEAIAVSRGFVLLLSLLDCSSDEMQQHRGVLAAVETEGHASGPAAEHEWVSDGSTLTGRRRRWPPPAALLSTASLARRGQCIVTRPVRPSCIGPSGVCLCSLRLRRAPPFFQATGLNLWASKLRLVE